MSPNCLHSHWVNAAWPEFWKGSGRSTPCALCSLTMWTHFLWLILLQLHISQSCDMEWNSTRINGTEYLAYKQWIKSGKSGQSGAQWGSGKRGDCKSGAGHTSMLYCVSFVLHFSTVFPLYCVSPLCIPCTVFLLKLFVLAWKTKQRVLGLNLALGFLKASTWIKNNQSSQFKEF